MSFPLQSSHENFAVASNHGSSFEVFKTRNSVDSEFLEKCLRNKKEVVILYNSKNNVCNCNKPYKPHK